MVLHKGKPAIAQDFGVVSRVGPHQFRFLCVDPGDEHVGLAEFTKWGADGQWLCTWAAEMKPEAFLHWYAEGLKKDRWEFVVVESWRLFPQAAPIYVGSDMPTSRLIGGIEALAMYLPEDGAWFDDPVEVHFQSPQIKVPTRGWLKRRKLRSVAKILKVGADHAQDAELHGYKFLIDHDQPVANATAQERHWLDQKAHLTPRHDLW